MRQDFYRIACIAIAIASANLVQAQDGATQEPVFVQTEVISDGSDRVTRQFFGQVTALKTVDVSFQVGGYLETLDAREGAFVEAGTLLAELDLDPFERAVERAELALAQSNRDLERARELASRNVGSDVQAENALTARDLADVALREAQAALEDARITAPFAGIIADRIGTSFTNIEPGQPILRLHNMSETRVEFDIPERLLAQIGDPSEVTFEGHLKGFDTPIPLTFREYRAETSQIGQSYTISLAAELTEDQLLLPGRTITVRASVAGGGSGHPVPSSAIATRSDGQTVVVMLEGDGPVYTARDVAVDVTSINGAQFLVSGVPTGAEIIAVGAQLVADGDPVKRFVGLTVEGL